MTHTKRLLECLEEVRGNVSAFLAVLHVLRVSAAVALFLCLRAQLLRDGLEVVSVLLEQDHEPVVLLLMPSFPRAERSMPPELQAFHAADWLAMAVDLLLLCLLEIGPVSVLLIVQHAVAISVLHEPPSKLFLAPLCLAVHVVALESLRLERDQVEVVLRVDVAQHDLACLITQRHDLVRILSFNQPADRKDITRLRILFVPPLEILGQRGVQVELLKELCVVDEATLLVVALIEAEYSLSAHPEQGRDVFERHQRRCKEVRRLTVACLDQLLLLELGQAENVASLGLRVLNFKLVHVLADGPILARIFTTVDEHSFKLLLGHDETRRLMILQWLIVQLLLTPTSSDHLRPDDERALHDCEWRIHAELLLGNDNFRRWHPHLVEICLCLANSDELLSTFFFGFKRQA